jgi:hypothetical protein
MSNPTIEYWEAGELTDLEALRALCSDLGEVESSLEPLSREREQLRDVLSRIVARLDGQKAEVRGFGQLAITGGGEVVSYDAKMLDALTAELLQLGDAHTASRIAAARKTSRRSSSLRVTREKAK